MNIKKDKHSITIKFGYQDWNNGKARNTMDFLKSLKSTKGKPLAYYQGFNKTWKLIRTPYTDGKLEEYISNLEDHQNRLELSNSKSLFDEYWDEVEKRNEI